VAATTTIRTRTVLVVEDDRSIRYLFTEVLRRAGYEVIACEDGTLGLEMARERSHRIDAVITDSSMPGLDSREMIAAIRALRPDIPVVVVSGSLGGDLSRFDDDPGILFLPKPLPPERLTRELERLLARPA
jgi:two-component system, cell cycle sensor histidine kinase and response regulator CckA